MPNRSTHATVGSISGGTFAVLRAADAPAPHLIVEAIGGLFGGWLGGILPDVLEPATSPNHRQLAHSVVAGGALTFAQLSEWQASCRLSADAAAQCALSLPFGSDERRSAEWDALLWRLLAGVLVGLVAGYASHLVL